MNTQSNRIRLLALALAALVLSPSVIQQARAASFTNAASMNTARFWHTATLLPNGTVLVVGGRSSSVPYLSSAEIYDPTDRTWTTTGSMNTGRIFHTATLLPNGSVLVVGGYQYPGNLSSAELYDPAAGTWTATGSLTAPTVPIRRRCCPTGTC